MSLSDTCDRIEAALKYTPDLVPCRDLFREVLRTLVELGEYQWREEVGRIHGPSWDHPCHPRWPQLKSRVEEALK